MKIKHFLIAFVLAFFTVVLFACKKDLNKVISKLDLPNKIVETAKDLQLPETIEGHTLEWSSNNETYKVEGFTLKVPSLPESDVVVTLTAKIVNSDAQKNIEITIKKAQVKVKEYKVVIPNEVKVVSPEGLDLTKVKENIEVVFQVVVPSDKVLNELKVNNTPVAVDADNKFKVVITKDITISCTFTEAITYTLTLPTEVKVVSPEGLDLTKVKENTVVELEVIVPDNKMLDTVKVNGDVVAVDKNKFSTNITKNTIVEVNFKEVEEKNLNEGLSLDDNTIFTLKDAVVVEKKGNNEVIVASTDYTKYSTIYAGKDSDLFKDINEKDIIKVFKVKKITDAKRGVQFVSGVKAEATSVSSTVEPINELTKDIYNLNNKFKIVKKDNLEITKINTELKDGEEIKKSLLVKDSENNAYNVYLNKTVRNEDLIKLLNVGDKINLNKIRIDAFNNNLQLRLDKIEQITKVSDVEEKINKALAAINIPSSGEPNTILNLPKEQNGFTIKWSSDNAKGYLDLETGKITNPLVHSVSISLIATITHNDITKSKKIAFSVGPRYKTASELIEEIPPLTFSGTDNANNITSNVVGAATITNKDKLVNVVWSVENPSAGAFASNVFTPGSLTADITTKFIATVEFDGKSATKEFIVRVKKNTLTDEEQIDEAIPSLTLPSELNSDQALTLVATLGKIAITWEEIGSPKLLNLTTGKLTNEDISEDKVIRLRATLTLNTVAKAKDFTVKFKAIPKNAAQLAALIPEPTYQAGDSAASITKTVEGLNKIMNLDTEVSIKWQVENASAGSFTNNIFTPSDNITSDITTKFIAEVEVAGVKATKEFNVTVKKNTLTDQEKVNTVKENVNINPTSFNNETTISVPLRKDGVSIAWAEEGSSLLTISDGEISLTDNNITEDKTITLKATFTLNSATATKTFTIKFLKKVDNSKSSIYSFADRTGMNGAQLDDDSLKELLENNQKQGDATIEEVSQTANVFDGGFKFNGHGDDEEKQAIQFGARNAGKTVIKFSKQIKQVIVKARSYSDVNNHNLKVNGRQKQVKYDKFTTITFDLKTPSDTITLETFAGESVSILEIEFVYA